jgi:hypothetical protein
MGKRNSSKREKVLSDEEAVEALEGASPSESEDLGEAEVEAEEKSGKVVSKKINKLHPKFHKFN